MRERLESIEPSARRLGSEGLAGVYGLVDAACPWRVRYVGSSRDVAHRVWEHMVKPHGVRLAEWKASGVRVAAFVLEPGASKDRECHWIDVLRAFGMADLNSARPVRLR